VDDAVVVGVGNPERGDDAVGWRVVDGLEGVVPRGVRLVRMSGCDPASLIGAWRDAGHAVVVDAMVSGAEPGTVARFDTTAHPLPPDVRLPSTHALGVQTAIDLARALDALPGRLCVIAVEGGRFDPGAPLNARMWDGVAEAVHAVLDELAVEVV
jgi:hydrogenase maturation protease